MKMPSAMMTSMMVKARPSFFPEPWLEWLRELGVTPAGLGLNAYRHTVMAVVLTALIAAKKNLTLDPVGLRDALQVPDFLTVIEDDLSQIVGAELWQWWLCGTSRKERDYRL